jgi:hypothetical protein
MLRKQEPGGFPVVLDGPGKVDCSYQRVFDSFREKNKEERMAVNAAEPGAPALREKEEDARMRNGNGHWKIIAHMFCFENMKFCV